MPSDHFSSAARRDRRRAIAALVLVSLAARVPALWLGGSDAGLLERASAIAAVVADVAITLLVFMVLSRLAPEAPQRAEEKAPPFWIRTAFWGGMAWAAHPLVVLVGSVAGHFDSLPLAAIFLAAWYVEFSDHPRSDLYAPLWFSLALALAAWPLVMLPLFIKSYSANRDRVRFALLALVLPAVLWWPSVASLQGLESRLFALSGPADLGLAKGLALLGLWPAALNPAAGAALLATAWLAYLLGPWKFPLLPGLALAGLALLASPQPAALQWLLLPLPFVLLVPGTLALRLGGVALGAALLHLGLNQPQLLFARGGFSAPQVPAWFSMAWGMFNLGLWFFWAREFVNLLKRCLKPARLRFR